MDRVGRTRNSNSKSKYGGFFGSLRITSFMGERAGNGKQQQMRRSADMRSAEMRCVGAADFDAETMA
jgi:hypothetical protein